MTKAITYVMHPDDFVSLGVGPDVAVEVDVVALGDIGRVDVAAEAQLNLRGIWRKERGRKSNNKIGVMANRFYQHQFHAKVLENWP